MIRGLTRAINYKFKILNSKLLERVAGVLNFTGANDELLMIRGLTRAINYKFKILNSKLLERVAGVLYFTGANDELLMIRGLTRRTGCNAAANPT